MHAYRAFMSVRKLLAVLIALAVLFAPAFSRAGEAFAAVPDHHMQMMDAGHCQSPPANAEHDKHDKHDKRDKAAEKSCCISMCMGVAVTPAAPPRASAPSPAPAIFAIRALHLSHLDEIATPPPKLA